MSFQLSFRALWSHSKQTEIQRVYVAKNLYLYLCFSLISAGYICDVMLVCLRYCVPLQWCAMIRAVLTCHCDCQLTGAGFDLAWFSSLWLLSASVSLVYIVLCCILNFITWWAEPGGIDPWLSSVLQWYVGWVIWPVKLSSKMTYNVLSGTLNPTIPYYTMFLSDSCPNDVVIWREVVIQLCTLYLESYVQRTT